MLSLLYRIISRNAPLVVLPFAVVIGTIGYALERRFGPKPPTIDYLNSSVQQQRYLRQQANEENRELVPDSLSILSPRPTNN
ncbi:unnamed protein product [Caenorhabditis auriculariae]|uniref:Small integral membrane protein 12 n=1 Tax=Caenorhabditis auriculariae TaxID=2777116 RepID=A0A8S1H036_9PELO|nr:unnamed protein product [Caenorhabditis auriculariae]